MTCNVHTNCENRKRRTRLLLSCIIGSQLYTCDSIDSGNICFKHAHECIREFVTSMHINELEGLFQTYLHMYAARICYEHAPEYMRGFILNTHAQMASCSKHARPCTWT